MPALLVTAAVGMVLRFKCKKVADHTGKLKLIINEFNELETSDVYLLCSTDTVDTGTEK